MPNNVLNGLHQGIDKSHISIDWNGHSTIKCVIKLKLNFNQINQNTNIS